MADLSLLYFKEHDWLWNALYWAEETKKAEAAGDWLGVYFSGRAARQALDCAFD